MIIIHYTAMESADLARERLCDPVAEVSAHWLISESGATEALVPEEARAWHAGRSHWRGISDVNSHSIGIELANPGTHPFPEPQMAALEDLLRGVMQRWQIPPEGVLAHSDIAPDRKIDPGPRFDWQRLARQGLAFWPQQMDAAGDFRAALLAYGYDPEASDADLLRAFRLRFYPMGQGAISAADLRLAAGLQRFPVDPPAPGA
nr:N-acetylmuramoyl-L-alanine amidase [Pseudogemmobacter hezensis]